MAISFSIRSCKASMFCPAAMIIGVGTVGVASAAGSAGASAAALAFQKEVAELKSGDAGRVANVEASVKAGIADGNVGSVSMRVLESMANPDKRRAEFAPCSTELAAAKQLLAKLDEMRDWNPRWWAINHRRIAVILARWAVASVGDGATADAVTLRTSALYESHNYDQWEAGQAVLGLRTARDIEKSQKWDGFSHVSTGLGYEFTTRYLASLRNPAPTSQPARNRPR